MCRWGRAAATFGTEKWIAGRIVMNCNELFWNDPGEVGVPKLFRKPEIGGRRRLALRKAARKIQNVTKTFIYGFNERFNIEIVKDTDGACTPFIEIWAFVRELVGEAQTRKVKERRSHSMRASVTAKCLAWHCSTLILNLVSSWQFCWGNVKHVLCLPRSCCERCFGHHHQNVQNVFPVSPWSCHCSSCRHHGLGSGLDPVFWSPWLSSQFSKKLLFSLKLECLDFSMELEGDQHCSTKLLTCLRVWMHSVVDSTHSGEVMSVNGL